MAFVFGFVIVGNVVDNVSTPKTLAIVLQIVLGTTWVLTGWETYLALNKTNCVYFWQATKIGLFA